MDYSTVYVGMDVHKDSFTLCAYTIEAEKGSYSRKTPSDYKEVLKYLEFLRTIYGDDARFICGYEAGCLGYTLYHQLTDRNVNCVIMAPSTMLERRGRKRVKTDKRDAELIGRCLAQHNYSSVYVPTDADEQIKEFLRMRDDHKLALKKIKQQILAFCLRHNYRYDGNSHWTASHLQWLRSLTPEALYKEILDEYLLTYDTLVAKLERLDSRIEELASRDGYSESVRKLCCFIGIKTHTALSVIVEVGVQLPGRNLARTHIDNQKAKRDCRKVKRNVFQRRIQRIVRGNNLDTLRVIQRPKSHQTSKQANQNKAVISPVKADGTAACNKGNHPEKH